ncbi:MAG: ferredoxin family protein [Chloroflexota bacterium]|nr:MAG: ferredoxin family protein [Chloroflexota bacterium]
MVVIEDKLSLLRYNADAETHIRVDSARCRTCPHHVCTHICPAGCYTLSDDSEILLSYTGCLECGTCRVMCDQEAIDWNYPRGGFGVSLRYT